MGIMDLFRKAADKDLNARSISSACTVASEQLEALREPLSIGMDCICRPDRSSNP
jgi:hypothetical protein